MATFTTVYHRKPYPGIDPAAPQNSMKGRSVLIAGATSGIGLATAHSYLKASPSQIIILGRREEVLTAAVSELNSARPANSSTKITGKQCDIADPAQVEKLWADLKSEHLQADILILNAAATTSSKVARLHDMTPFFDMNVTANLRMADAFLAQGPATGKVIINVSTMAAHASLGNTLNVVAYGSSKAAGAAAIQAAADCIPVEECFILNVHPGAILTESARRAGYEENSIPWDDPALPGAFFVWASTPQATFLHGRFVWCHWDIDELVAMKPRFEDDAGFLRIGLQGIPTVDVKETFARIARWDQGPGEGVSVHCRWTCLRNFSN